MQKVEAQQARRILDRLVGYQVSPFLWRPIRPGLSAGRVQTVALRLICEREDEIRAFESVEYWSVTARLRHGGQPFESKLHRIDRKAFSLGDEASARAVVEEVTPLDFKVGEVTRKERKKNPAPPFTTSTLQQQAAQRLRFSARRTMQHAQKLYEGVELGSRGSVGLITYMRTDSTRVSGTAVHQARRWVEREFGAEYVPASPRLWGGKQQKAAQEAHEAIRPTDVGLHPDRVRRFVDRATASLYELIWLRFVASQMSAAIHDTTTVDFPLTGASGRSYLFRSTGSIMKFQGFTRLYREATVAGERRRLGDLEPLPELAVGDSASVDGIDPRQHFTQPPPRFSEASLVRELEKRGIGRPSTYAQIVSTIRDREYVEVEDRRFRPTPLGDVVSKLLVRVFPDIFKVEFTSRMETALDRIEEGQLHWRTLLGEFYPPFREQLKQGEPRSAEIIKAILAADGETCDLCGRPMQVRFNRRGRFLGCVGYPGCKGRRALDGEAPEEVTLGRDPDTDLPVHLKEGPYGPYVQLGDGEGRRKPKRASLPKDWKIEDVGLPEALRLLSLPRTVGKDPETGEEVVAGLGRYGPFVRRGRTFASLANAAEMFTVGLEEALQRVKKQEAGPSVLRKLGPHPRVRP